MLFGEVRFHIASHTAWAPGINTEAAWLAWAHGHTNDIASETSAGDPGLPAMPPMLRRRASATGKMALQVAYDCLPADTPATLDTASGQHSARATSTASAGGMPVIFASRHGECMRSVALLDALIARTPMSPATFSLSVHNANAGLFSIARGDRSNHIAIAAGASTVEHALIEACGLLADGARQVLLAVADTPPPAPFRAYDDCAEQAYAWAWLLQKATNDANATTFSLTWRASTGADHDPPDPARTPAGLSVLRFFLSGATSFTHVANQQCWQWSRHA